MAKMSEPGLGSERIAAIAGCSRNFGDSLIHSYNNKGIDSVLETASTSLGAWIRSLLTLYSPIPWFMSMRSRQRAFLKK